jgi:hypothetical protein
MGYDSSDGHRWIYMQKNFFIIAAQISILSEPQNMIKISFPGDFHYANRKKRY